MQVRLAVLACRHELATGHAHMAVAAVQALLEFHCFAPPALGELLGAIVQLCCLLQRVCCKVEQRWLSMHLQGPALVVRPHAMSLICSLGSLLCLWWQP